MGLFDKLFESNDPLTQAQKKQAEYTQALNKFCGYVYEYDLGHFRESDFLEYMHEEMTQENVNILHKVLMNAMQEDLIYASFSIYCPNCQKLVTSGAAVVRDNNGNKVINLLEGIVPLEQLDLVCPYCNTQLPKENQLHLGAETIIYRLSPNTVYQLKQANN